MIRIFLSFIKKFVEKLLRFRKKQTKKRKKKKKQKKKKVAS